MLEFLVLYNRKKFMDLMYIYVDKMWGNNVWEIVKIKKNKFMFFYWDYYEIIFVWKYLFS